jgi:hypothetical protein
MEARTRFQLGEASDPCGYIIVHAPDSGRTWNGFAVPVLTAVQAVFVARFVHEPPIPAGPSEGLQWARLPETSDPETPETHDDTYVCSCGAAVLYWQLPAYWDGENCGACEYEHARESRGLRSRGEA